MTAGTVLALALIVALGLAEIALWSHQTGHSIAHIATLGIVSDTRNP